MKKLVLCIICLSLVFSLSACKNENNEILPSEESVPEVETGIVPNSVPDDSEEAISVKATVKNYLDTFISCDFDAIRSIIHEDDQWYFNLEDEEQLEFYKAVFPQIEYKFEFVSEYEGVYGVMTEMTSPDMAEVYGSVITDYLDATAGYSTKSTDEIKRDSTKTMLEMIKSPDLPRRVERLYVYVECIDGVYIPRCDVFLANELTGGAPEISDEITTTLSESLGALSE